MATNMINLIQSQVDGLNDTLRAISLMPKSSVFQTASGYWLDLINRLIGGTERLPNTYPDSELRIRMSKKIEMNCGCGTKQSVSTACRYYLYLSNDNTWANVETIDLYVYTSGTYIVIEASGENIKNRDKFKEIQNFIPVGVGLLIIETFDDNTFRCSDSDGNVADLSTYREGLSSIQYPQNGGKLSSILNINGN